MRKIQFSRILVVSVVAVAALAVLFTAGKQYLDFLLGRLEPQYHEYDISSVVGIRGRQKHEQLERQIRDTVEVDSLSFAFNEDKVTVIIKAAQREHERLRPLLDSFGPQKTAVQIQVQMASFARDEIPESLLESLQVSRKQVKPGVSAMLDDAGLQKVMTAIADSGSGAMPSRKLSAMMLDGIPCTVFCGETLPWIKGYKKNRLTSSATEYEPEVEIANFGTELGLTAKVSPDRKSVKVQLEPRLSELLDMETIPFNDSPELVTHKITSKFVRVSTTAVIPDRSTHAFVLGKDPSIEEAHSIVLLLLTPTIINR